MNVSTTSTMDWTSTVAYHPNDQFDERPFISDEANAIAEQVVAMVMLAVACLGIVTNVVNIRVYVEQGGLRSDASTTIGLLYLSTYDLCACLFMTPLSICHLFHYFQATMSLKITCIAYGTTMVYAHVVFSYTSAWTTVYLSLERTLCVVFPTKVKQIFTPKTTAVVLTMVFLFFFSLQLPYTASTSVVWRYTPEFNQSLAYVYDSKFARTYLYYYSIIVNTSLSSIAIFVVFVNTVILIHKLKEFQKWRQKNKNTTAANYFETSGKKQLNSKDAELVKSMTVVTGIFLVCASMTHVPSTILMTLPGVSFTGVNRNLFHLAHYIQFLFNSINASINFFFYVSISTRYKDAFRSVRMKCRGRQGA